MRPAHVHVCTLGCGKGAQAGLLVLKLPMNRFLFQDKNEEKPQAPSAVGLAMSPQDPGTQGLMLPHKSLFNNSEIFTIKMFSIIKAPIC